jgi:hypothetical protein
MTPEQEARFAQTLAEEDRVAAERLEAEAAAIAAALEWLEAEVPEKALGQKDGSKRRRRDPG